MSDDNDNDDDTTIDASECDLKQSNLILAAHQESVKEKDIHGANDEALRIRISLLEEEHRDLDTAIKALQTQPSPEVLVIARLKKKKLILKDEIMGLLDQVEPDIIA